MDLFVLSGLNLSRLGLIDNATSIIWNKKYFSCGDCVLKVETTEKNISILKKNNFLLRADVQTEICIIETVTYTKDENGNNIIQVQGSFAHSLLGRRIVWDSTLLNGNTVLQLRGLIDNNATGESLSDDRKLCMSATVKGFTGNNIDRESGATVEIKSISGQTTIEQVGSGSKFVLDVPFFADIEQEVILISDKNIYSFGQLTQAPYSLRQDTIYIDGGLYKRKKRVFISNNIKETIRTLPVSISNNSLCFYKGGILAEMPYSDNLKTESGRVRNTSLSAKDWYFYCKENYICLSLPISEIESIYQTRTNAIIKSNAPDYAFDVVFKRYTKSLAEIIRNAIYNNNLYESFVFEYKEYYKTTEYKTEWRREWNGEFWYEYPVEIPYEVTKTRTVEKTYSFNASFDFGDFPTSMLVCDISETIENTGIAVRDIEKTSSNYMLSDGANISDAIMYLEQTITYNDGEQIVVLESEPISNNATMYEIVKGENLQEYTEKVLEKNGLGLSSVFNANTKKIEIAFINGKNRTVKQKENKQIVFSRELDNLLSYSITESMQGKYNIALCVGKNNNTEYTATVGSGKGLERREKYIESSDLDSFSEASYVKALEDKGELELQGLTIAIDSSIDSLYYKYRQDYNIGDIVTIIISDMKLQYDVRILEVCETWDIQGYKITLVLGE